MKKFTLCLFWKQLSSFSYILYEGFLFWNISQLVFRDSNE